MMAYTYFVLSVFQVFRLGYDFFLIFKIQSHFFFIRIKKIIMERPENIDEHDHTDRVSRCEQLCVYPSKLLSSLFNGVSPES